VKVSADTFRDAASEDRQTMEVVTPGFKLTEEERAKKSDQHKFGLCCDCDAGLDDRADFICDYQSNGGMRLICSACSDFRPLVSSSSEGEASLVLPGEVDGIEVLIVSPMPSLRYDSDDSDADINELLLPVPHVGELEEVVELQLPAPLTPKSAALDRAGNAGQKKHVRAQLTPKSAALDTVVEHQLRGSRHVHLIFKP